LQDRADDRALFSHTLALAILSVRPCGLAVFVTILPRLRRLPIVPQSTAMLARIPLGRGELADVFMLRVVPSVSFADLIDVDMTVADVNSAAIPAFAVDLDGVEADVFAVNLRGEALLRVAPVRLPFLGGIDSVQTDVVPATAFIQNRARIAVVHGDDSATDRSVFNTPLVPPIIPPLVVAPVVRGRQGSQAKCQRKSNQGT
jgi:hypothetical protein